ncbi:TetR/AcrR family transcriptional regulator [Micromonospora sp. STR1s_5]|nr:TetR/AcrR family transcriptional regulator [Micromonospora sp. STR1s_5]
MEDPRLIELRLPRIVTAAAEEFADRGYHVTTVQDVAKRAGVSVGMIYQYVADKQDLLNLVIGGVVSAYEEEVRRNSREGGEPLGRLVSLVRGLARVVVEHKAAARLGYREASQLRRDRLDDIKDRERALAAVVAERIRACVEAGVCSPTNEAMLAYMCLIFVQSWPVSSWRLDREISHDEYVSEGLQILFRGLMPGRNLAALFGMSPAAAT